MGEANALRSLQPREDRHETSGLEDFGVTYVSGAVSTAVPRPTTSTRRPPWGSTPGPAGAPYVWLDVTGRRVSTLDLLGGRLTLLAGVGGGDWCAAAKPLVADGPPLAVLPCGPDLPDPDGSLARRYGVDGQGAVLVRPDEYVGWWTGSASADPATVLGPAIELATDEISDAALTDMPA